MATGVGSAGNCVWAFGHLRQDFGLRFLAALIVDQSASVELSLWEERERQRTEILLAIDHAKVSLTGGAGPYDDTGIHAAG
jgi:hypothetical protein